MKPKIKTSLSFRSHDVLVPRKQSGTKYRISHVEHLQVLNQTKDNCNKSQTRTTAGVHIEDKHLLCPFQISHKASDNLSSISAQLQKRDELDKQHKGGKVGILKNYLKRNNLSQNADGEDVVSNSNSHSHNPNPFVKDCSSDSHQFKIHISDNDNENLDQNESGGQSPNFLLLMNKEEEKIEPKGIQSKFSYTGASSQRKTLKRRDGRTFNESGNEKQIDNDITQMRKIQEEPELEIASPTQTSSGPDEEQKEQTGFKISLIKAPTIRPKVQKYESLMNFVDKNHNEETLSEKERNIQECRKFYEQFDKKVVSKVNSNKV